jgi:hypothetical protein
MTAQAALPTLAGMATTTATTDPALAINRMSLCARTRGALILATLLALAGAGFSTARALTQPAGARTAPVCSETCTPLATAPTALPSAGKETR